MVKKTSAGIISYYFDKDKQQYLFLVAKPGGPYWYASNKVGFIKGEVEQEDSLLDTALREFLEESNITITEKEILNKYHPIYYDSKKHLYFYLHDSQKPFDIDVMYANEFYDEKTQQYYPENDAYYYLNFQELKERLLPSQQGIIRLLEEELTTS